jgi:predicted ester cyclase
MSETSSVGRRFFEAQDRLRGGPDDALCTPDYTATIEGFPPMDLDGHKQFAAAFYVAFPDVRHEFDSIEPVDGGERVRFRLVGNHTGDFMGIPPTGKPIDVAADVRLQVQDGKVKAVQGAFDQAGLMRQLGVNQ